MSTFDEPTQTGKNWDKKKQQRDQIMERDLEKANKPTSVFEQDNLKPKVAKKGKE